MVAEEDYASSQISSCICGYVCISNASALYDPECHVPVYMHIIISSNVFWRHDWRPESPPVIQTERSVGGRGAIHRILLEEGRYVQIDERLVTSQECSRAPRDAISWAPWGSEGRQADFCITASGAVGSNVMVRLTIPRLETDYERRVVEAFHLISSCKIERGPFEFFSSDRFVIGRQLWIPRIER